MLMTDLRHALPEPLALALDSGVESWESLERAIPRLPRSRAGLAGRLRALSAARLAVAIFLGSGAPPITTDIGAARPRQRPTIATEGAAAA
jgi:hypothetical protein